MSITIVSAVMNRADMLRVSLMSWLKYKEVTKIIVVDWSSSDLSADFVKSFCLLDDRIEFKRVDNKDTYHVSAAWNIAFSHVDTEFVLKMDVDYILNPYFNFFDIHKLSDKDFFTGDYRMEVFDNKLGFMKYLHGLLYIRTADFRAVGGFDERFVNYSFEDTDIYARLRKQGLTHRFIDVKKLSVYHNPHGNDKRTENFVEKDVNKSLRTNGDMFRKNNAN